jgi:subtilisin family serine protease
LASTGCGAPEGNVVAGAEKIDGSADAATRVLAPPVPAVAPEIPDVSDMDQDRNRVDDMIDADLAAAGVADAEITVQAIFARPLVQADIDRFLAGGGSIRHVFRALSYGWIGTLRRSNVPAMAASLGPNLLIIAGDRPITLHLDKATRTGRVRPVWVQPSPPNAMPPNGFAGPGFSGASTTTIAIVDTGVDKTHTDLAGRDVFWADPSGEYAIATDPRGHGTHVAGIATGTGAALGLGSTLKYTDGGDLTGVASGNGFVNAIDLFGSPLTITSIAHWPSGGSTVLAFMNGDNGAAPYALVNNVTGPSPLTFTSTFTPNAAKHYSPLLSQRPTAPLLTTFAIENTVTNYPTVDSFNTLRGVAPGCQWAAVKVFHADGTGVSSELVIGLDDLVGNNIKVANMSLGLTPANTSSAPLRAVVNSLAANGVVVVASAGNDGPAGIMSDPARAGLVVTVGATNDVNQLTDYTSTGFAPIADPPMPPDTREDEKPDILAPGGSPRYSDILSADSNNDDAQSTTFPDLVPNDYASLHGTSMAAPFATGAAALIIEALESTGLTWSYASSAHPRLVKMLLSASATETNQLREGSISAGANDPTLGRSAAPKDRNEGYGIINPDAAIEAVRLDYEGSFTGTTTGSPTDRRAWGRRIALTTGNIVSVTLTSATADYDLYLYSATPNPKGNPVILAASTLPGIGVTDQISYTAVANGTAYLFIKRVSGSGTFNVVGGVCGNGKVEAAEQCDDGNQSAADCCTALCKVANNGASCDDGSKCTSGDTCQAGTCTGSPVVCSPIDACHDAGTCNPATGVCSTAAKANGASCDDGSACTAGETCQAGICGGGTPVVCAALDSCHDAGVCNPANGTCSNPPKANGTACSDGNACTQSDTCQGGTCTGASPVVCSALDPCHDVGTCNPSNGTCSNPAKTDGTACNDGNACTQSDTCQSGTCTGASPVVCSALDQCHDVGTCNPSNGTCSNPAKANGAACNDSNACTQSDTCQGGACAGSNPVTCTALDQCHDPGVCDPASGACSNPNKTNGTTCNDGNACTRSDTCQSGTCTGANPVVCTATDQCHVAGTCDPASGACSNPAKQDGSSCVDGNACTQTDICQSGACVGTNPVTCVAQDQCHDAGVCNPTSGVCSNPAKSDGSLCNDGNACTQVDACLSGACVGAMPIVCTALDQCHVPGACDPASGVCSNPAQQDGTACDDGSACTHTDACQAGQCVGKTPVVCTAKDQCHDVGACDAATGVCSDPAKADGASCNDGDACTKTDTCQAGACTGTNLVVCAALDQCHDPGTCDHATGSCSNPSKADGAACNDQNACTRNDVCRAGSCEGGDPVVCDATDECHSAGTCDPVSGACSNPKKPDGAACSTGNCSAGICSATGDAGPGGGTGSEAGLTGDSGGKDGSLVASLDGSTDARLPDGGYAAMLPSVESLQPESSSGCGCRVSGPKASAGAYAGLLLGLVAMGRRRRVPSRRVA